MRITGLGLVIACASLAVFAAASSRSATQHNEIVAAINTSDYAAAAPSLQAHERAALQTGERLTEGLEWSVHTLDRVRRSHEARSLREAHEKR